MNNHYTNINLHLQILRFHYFRNIRLLFLHLYNFQKLFQNQFLCQIQYLFRIFDNSLIFFSKFLLIIIPDILNPIFLLNLEERLFKISAKFVFVQWRVFRSRTCSLHQSLNEDNTLNFHVIPPLRKHFVGDSSILSICPITLLFFFLIYLLVNLAR